MMIFNNIILKLQINLKLVTTKKLRLSNKSKMNKQGCRRKRQVRIRSEDKKNKNGNITYFFYVKKFR